MLFASIFLSIFIIIFILLCVLQVKDSAGRNNNAILVFYFAIALWITTGLAGVFSQVQSSVVESRPTLAGPAQKGGKRITTRVVKSSKTGHYSIVLWGMMVLGGIYVIRRPEWAQLVINGIGAWKSKDIENDKEALIHHGLRHPEDRQWVEHMISLLDNPKRKEEDKSEEAPVPDTPPR